MGIPNIGYLYEVNEINKRKGYIPKKFAYCS